MPRTIDSFPNPSHGAMVDTGLDSFTYQIRGKPIPSDDNLNSLYTFLVKEINSGKADDIHNHIKNKTYKTYLPAEFHWVCTGWEY